MNLNKLFINIGTVRAVFFQFLIISAGFLFSSCNSKLPRGTIVFTRVSGNLPIANFENGKSWRLIEKAQLVAINPANSESEPIILSSEFYSACSPMVSNDGKSVVFSGQKKQNDVWQVYKLITADLKIYQLTNSDENCIDPFFLPDEQIGYSQFAKNDSLGVSYSLFTYNLKGNKIEQITYNPQAYFSPTVLPDGRILTTSKQLLPSIGQVQFMVMRPDGTKEELFYKGIPKSNLISRGYELNNEKVVFVESDSSKVGGGNLVEVNYGRPLHSRINLSEKLNGSFYAVYPIQHTTVLVSFKPLTTNKTGLYLFDTESKTLGKTIYSSNDFNVLDAVVIKEQKRPRILPSEIKSGSPTGLLLCQNVNETSLNSLKTDSIKNKAAQVLLIGVNKIWGVASVEDDGSFYLKVVSNTPFRMQTINSDGKVINGPSSWIYLRPNERHGCVGCHADNEQTPENIQPMAVQKAPQIITTKDNKVTNISF